MGGKASKEKGTREEVAIVNAVRTLDGWFAHRVPLSGAIAGYPGDVILRAPDGRKFRAESKVRAAGFKQIYKWLGDNDLLWIRADHLPGMWVVKDTVMIEFFEGYGKGKCDG